LNADLEWVEKPEPRIKRKVRITFVGHDKIKWQFKRSNEELWDYDSLPSAEDWGTLETKIEALYNRRRAPYKHVELVKKLRKEAG
jgi:hypothetical protein